MILYPYSNVFLISEILVISRTSLRTQTFENAVVRLQVIYTVAVYGSHMKFSLHPKAAARFVTAVTQPYAFSVSIGRALGTVYGRVRIRYIRR